MSPAPLLVGLGVKLGRMVWYSLWLRGSPAGVLWPHCGSGSCPYQTEHQHTLSALCEGVYGECVYVWKCRGDSVRSKMRT